MFTTKFLLFKFADSVFNLSVCECSTFSFIDGTFKTQKFVKAQKLSRGMFLLRAILVMTRICFPKSSFPKEPVENADFYKPALNKIMTTHE